MYLYSLHGYESNIILTNDKEYTEEEFKKMCKEAPLGGFKFGNGYYSSTKIQEYLIDMYEFRIANYTAGFFFDADAE